MPDSWQFWVDRGGTFTDVVARQPDGTIATAKLLSEDPDRYDDAAVEANRRSHIVASTKPPPAATPLTAAMTGFGCSSR